MKPAIAWLLPLLLLAACASPRYETSVSYLPPADEAGRACIAECSEALTACQDDCAARWATCRESVEPQARQRFEEAVHRYEGAREQYETDRLFYEINRNLSWGWGYGGRPFGWMDAFDAPVPPAAPSLDEIRARLVVARCDARCACQARYEQCFLGCGGRIDRSTRCVANCSAVER
ncbi:MAG: hypothetical protein ACOC00_06150 [Halothiobacillaceae bacterium]